jgi:hypothetical protein
LKVINKMGRYSRSASRSRSRGRERGRDRNERERDRDRDRDGDDNQYEDEGYRVHIADLGIDCSQKELEKTYTKFGETKEIWLAKNPPCFAFCVYNKKTDAEDAIKETDGRYISHTLTLFFLIFIII